MATIFKTFLKDDITTTRTKLHEAIPLTGTIVSGTYGGTTIALGSEGNIKTYSHGMFQSVYDYPYLSSSANHVFDITVGISSASVDALAGSPDPGLWVQKQQKINIYNQMAKMLVGHDVTGGIMEFDADGNIVAGGKKIREAIFINFARLLTKDEIKKESFTITLGTHQDYDDPHASLTSSSDLNASTSYKVNSPAGEYAVLSASLWAAPEGRHSAHSPDGDGLVYYQAGIAVLTASVFNNYEMAGDPNFDGDTGTAEDNINCLLTGSTIDKIANSVRNRINNIQFNNTTELNSTIYFCRINHNDFNYSSNPTYLKESKIMVKESHSDIPVSYITSVGLYSPSNELLAVAKLSEPLRNDSTTNLTLRVRTDF